MDTILAESRYFSWMPCIIIPWCRYIYIVKSQIIFSARDFENSENDLKMICYYRLYVVVKLCLYESALARMLFSFFLTAGLRQTFREREKS